MANVNTAHRGVRIAAALAAVIFGATACGSDNNSSSATAPADVPKSVSADEPVKSDTANGDAAQVPSVTRFGRLDRYTDIAPIPIPDNKFLAIDVSYGVEVDDITKGINGVVALADRHGGQIYERTINITDDRSSTASFVIKLPPAQVEAAIADLDAIGVRRTASQGTEDVTSQAVDIDARLVSAQASLERVRKLLEAATDLGQVLSLESQLTERETLVEQLTAMKRALDDRVSLATLRVQLTPQSGSRFEGRRRTAEGDDHRFGIQDGVERLHQGAGRGVDLHGLHRTVPRAAADRRRCADPDQSTSAGGATKSISCSTAPTSSGRRSANVRTRFRRRGQKSLSDTPSASHIPCFHSTDRGTSGHSARSIT